MRFRVSTPVTWEELEAASNAGDAAGLQTVFADGQPGKQMAARASCCDDDFHRPLQAHHPQGFSNPGVEDDGAALGLLIRHSVPINIHENAHSEEAKHEVRPAITDEGQRQAFVGTLRPAKQALIACSDKSPSMQ